MSAKFLPKFLGVLALLALALLGASQATPVADAAPPCPPCTIEPPPRPDLRVSARSAEPNGTQWAVSFTATNSGERPAGGFQAVVKNGATTVHTVQVGALASDQSRTYSFSYPKTGCSVTLVVTLDPGHAVAEANESNNTSTISRDTCPPPPGPPGNTAVWRAQLRLLVADVDDAGTDDSLKVELNDGHRTWLDYGRDDFEGNSDFTYDLVLTNVSKLDDINFLKITKTGSDGLCLRSMDLLINGKRIFTQNFMVARNPCRWIDSDDGHSPVLTVARATLRAHTLWQTYTQPNPPLVIPRDEIESRIESIVGDQLHGTALYWGQISGRAVEATRKNDNTLHIDLDLAYAVNNWFDPEVDVDLDMTFTCSNGKLVLTASNVDVHVDANWITDVLSLGLVNIAEHYIDEAIQDALQNYTYTTEVGVPRCPTIIIQPNGDIILLP